MTAFNPQTALRAWANREAELQHELEVAQWFRDLEYQRSLAQTDKDIERLKAALKDEETALRQQLREYVAETGDLLKDVDGASVRRVSPLVYDKAAAFAWAEEHAPHLIRVKKELDVRKFEDALNNERVSWDGAEKVNEVQIVLNKLGHLVEGKEGRE